MALRSRYEERGGGGGGGGGVAGGGGVVVANVPAPRQQTRDFHNYVCAQCILVVIILPVLIVVCHA